jgi:hypothetical protein
MLLNSLRYKQPRQIILTSKKNLKLPSSGIQQLPSHLVTRWFLTRLISNPKDGGDSFLRNVGSYTD